MRNSKNQGKGFKNVPFPKIAVQIFFTLMIGSAILYQCSKDGLGGSAATDAIILPKENQNTGELLSAVLRKTAVQVKAERISFSDTEKVQNISKHVVEDVFKAKGIKKSDFSSVPSTTEYKKISDLLSDDAFTATQKEYIKKIEVARINSKSYNEFAQELVQINNEIVEKVSLDERAALLNLTSTLHYSLSTLNDLVNEGIVRGTPEKGVTKISVISLKAGFLPAFISISFLAGCDGWWSCWGKCAAGTIGGAGLGVLTTGGPWGGVFGGLAGAADNC